MVKNLFDWSIYQGPAVVGHYSYMYRFARLYYIHVCICIYIIYTYAYVYTYRFARLYICIWYTYIYIYIYICIYISAQYPQCPHCTASQCWWANHSKHRTWSVKRTINILRRTVLYDIYVHICIMHYVHTVHYHIKMYVVEFYENVNVWTIVFPELRIIN